MKAAKIRVGILFGGRSGEHEVSIQSARSVYAALNQEKYDITCIGITHTGEWVIGEDIFGALENRKTDFLTRVTILPEPGHNRLYLLRPVADKVELVPHTYLDVVFPVLHGTFGEDGTIQGLLELAGIAYAGSGVLGSAVGMDKALFKDLMRAHQIPVLESRVFNRSQVEKDFAALVEEAEKISPYPLFVKPANLGSSVGITKCRNRSDLYEGVMEAARFDRRILIERGLQKPRELEVSVLGNDNPEASMVGEIVPGDDFYTYSAKYISDNSQLLIPAPLSTELSEEIRRLSIKIYKAADCSGLCRVDFLFDPQDQSVYVSEINTMPGFTRISMYPKMWEASGLPYPKLVERLIELGLERKQDRDRTEFEYRRD